MKHFFEEYGGVALLSIVIAVLIVIVGGIKLIDSNGKVEGSGIAAKTGNSISKGVNDVDTSFSKTMDNLNKWNDELNESKLPAMKLNVINGSAVYDTTFTTGGAKVTITEPANAVIKYGTTKDECNLDEIPKYENAGTYTIYYIATAEGYKKATGSFEIVINKESGPDFGSGFSYFATLASKTDSKPLVPSDAIIFQYGRPVYFRETSDDEWSSIIPTFSVPGAYEYEFYVEGNENIKDSSISKVSLNLNYSPSSSGGGGGSHSSSN